MEYMDANIGPYLLSNFGPFELNLVQGRFQSYISDKNIIFF